MKTCWTVSFYRSAMSGYSVDEHEDLTFKYSAGVVYTYDADGGRELTCATVVTENSKGSSHVTVDPERGRELR